MSHFADRGATRALLDGLKNEKPRRLLELRIAEDKVAEAQRDVNKAHADYSAAELTADIVEYDPSILDNLSLSEDKRHALRQNPRRQLRDVNLRVIDLTEIRNQRRLDLSQLQTHMRMLQQQINLLQKKLQYLERWS